MNLNKAELIGNLVADPIVKALSSGMTMARFRMATNRAWRDNKTKKLNRDVEYHPVIAWGRLGEIVGKYLKKGDKVYIEGRLQTREWEDKNKVKRYQTEIVASNMIMLGSKNGKAPKQEKVEDDVVVEEVDLKKALPQEA